LSITLTSLSSTLESCLKWHEEALVAWQNKKELLYAKHEEEKVIDGGSPDWSELDSAAERIAYWEGMLVAYELLLDLLVAVSNNPFPGQKMRLLQIATTLYPEAEGAFAPKERLRGRGYWRQVLRNFELDSERTISFPVKVDNVDVLEVERRLLELAVDCNFILLQVAKQVLTWEPRSRTYREVKNDLEKRGWEWGNKRIEGKQTKVIFTPL
jgi:hypothetical protein